MIKRLLLLCMVGTISASPVDEFKYGKAVGAAQTTQWKKAQEDLTVLLADMPDRSDLLYDLGVTSYRNEQFDPAAAYFKQAAQNALADAALQEQSYFNLGNAQVQLKELKEAIASYEKTLEINPDNIKAKENRDLVQQMLEEQEQEQKKKEEEEQQKQNEQQNQQKKEQQQKKNQQDQNNGSGQDQQNQQGKNDQQSEGGSSKDKQEQQEAGQSNHQSDDDNGDDNNDNKGSDNDSMNQKDNNKDNNNESKQGSDPSDQENNADQDDAGNDKRGQEHQSEANGRDQGNSQQHANEKLSHENANEDNHKGSSTHHHTPEVEQPAPNSVQDRKPGEKKQEGEGQASGFSDDEPDKEQPSYAQEPWVASLLEQNEKSDKQAHKQMVKATLQKKLGGNHGKQGW